MNEWIKSCAAYCAQLLLFCATENASKPQNASVDDATARPGQKNSNIITSNKQKCFFLTTCNSNNNSGIQQKKYGIFQFSLKAVF